MTKFKWKLLVLSSFLMVCVSGEAATFQKVYCIEKDLADAPAWSVIVDKNEAELSGNIQILGEIKKLKLVRNKNLASKRLPFGSFQGELQGRKIKFVLESLVMIGNEPFEKYRGALISMGNGYSELNCYSAQ